MPTTYPHKFWQGKRVFLTGGSGLLGGWTMQRLLAYDADIVALMRDGVPSANAARSGDLGRVTTVHGSVEDPELMLRAMAEYEIDTVLHLAAQPIVGVAKVDPVGTFRANIQGTWNILDAARRTAVKQTIIASSDKAYGDSDHLPYREDYPLQGRYPYDCSKSCADLLAQTYLTTYQMPVSIVRCANLFGGGDLNFNRLIPGVIQATLQETPFCIRSDGQFVRDYLYVADAADSYLHLAERLADGAPQGAYNFSLELKLTVLDIVSQVLQLLERTELKPIILNQASSEIRAQYLSCEKARQLLDWAPAYSMEEGLRATIDWYRQHVRLPSPPTRAAAVST